ncbi:MAG: CBS domain-containing protein [Gammaproteobacteria bacterium]|nr:CBS domain-containing protein [Gammaproteobacteria bacterium]MDH5800326.1 CBS domain-containing protein [Gammaproteobacteria bacterium]
MSYKILTGHSITQKPMVNRRTVNRPTNVSLDDPALLVMTDFNLITPYSIEPTASIDATNEKMIACGVRLLFVTDSNHSLLGLITATDILGEKPLQYLKEHSGRRDEIMAQDIMTPHNMLDVVHMSDVEYSCVGDIIETAKAMGRQHLLVVEFSGDIARQTIRGLFSTTQISRQLGASIDIAERANTFAELGKAIASV